MSQSPETTELAKVEEKPIAPPQSDAVAIMQMITANPNLEPERMDRLFDLYERAQRHEAEKAFNRDFAAMQDDLPIIKERGNMSRGGAGQQKYALWEDVVRQIRPALAKWGFALSFQPEILEGNKVKVTAKLSHRDGHAEQSVFQLPADVSGAKNPVQALGSSVSYAKRYLASAMLNLATTGEDDDGQAAGGNANAVIDDGQEEKLRTLITENAIDIHRFLAYFRIESLSDLPANQFRRAKSVIAQAAEKRARAAE
jgi:hypothetical protein